MKNKIIEILCVVFAVIFIVYSFSGAKDTNKTVNEIEIAVCEKTDISGLTKRDNLFFKNTFGLSAEETAGFVYYTSDDVMDVRELLIVKYNNAADKDVIIKAAEKYYNSRYDIYAGYAPEQGELIKNKIWHEESGVLFVYVGPNADITEDAYLRAL